jgi:hypothetical protein
LDSHEELQSPNKSRQSTDYAGTSEESGKSESVRRVNDQGVPLSEEESGNYSGSSEEALVDGTQQSVKVGEEKKIHQVVSDEHQISASGSNNPTTLVGQAESSEVDTNTLQSSE